MRCFILFLLFPVVLASQQLSVRSDRYLADRRGVILPTPVFMIHKNDTSLFGAGKMPGFRLPESKGPSGFAFMGCPYAPAAYPFRWNVPVYFTHIGESRMCAYADRNFNGDYTDDGEAACMDSSGLLTVTFADPAHAGVEIRTRYRMLSSILQPDTALVRLFAGNGFYAGVTLDDLSLWLAAEPLLIKGTDLVIGQDSVCVVTWDRNSDGCYNGTGDMITLLPYGSDSVYTTPSQGMRDVVPGRLLGFRGKAYEIIFDSTKYGAVSLRARPELQPPDDLAIGDSLPHFSVMFFSNDSADIYTVMRPGTYLYLEFWGAWCGSCRRIIPSLKALHDTLGNRLTIVSLDAYDDRAEARTFVAEHGMRWVQGFSNGPAMKLVYGNEQYPYGILVDPEGRIVAFDVSPEEVAKIVSGR